MDRNNSMTDGWGRVDQGLGRVGKRDKEWGQLYRVNYKKYPLETKTPEMNLFYHSHVVLYVLNLYKNYFIDKYKSFNFSPMLFLPFNDSCIYFCL